MKETQKLFHSGKSGDPLMFSAPGEVTDHEYK
jgi:hypothetical protein